MRLSHLALLLCTAVVTHVTTVVLLPWGIMFGVIQVTPRATGTAINELFNSGLADAANQRIVRPSPDVAYSICVYDLSAGPVQISAAIDGDSYTSISAYAANSDNFAVVNDREAQGGAAGLILHRVGQSVARRIGWEAAASPTDTGIVLVRRVVLDADHLEQVVKLQEASSCSVVAES